MRSEYLELADYLLIAEAVTGIPAEALARSNRVVSLADSALHAPQAAYGGTELYPDLVDKAAVLCSRLARNHPLPDANKRCAFLALVEFLERNDRRLSPPGGEDHDEEVAATIEAVAAGTLDEKEFSRWLSGHIEPTNS